MIYLCFDTNVYIKLLLDNIKNESFFDSISDESSLIISELHALLESEYYTILLPEVIELELEKQNASITKDILNNCNLLKTTIEETKKNIWNENHELVLKLHSTIDTFRDNKITIWQKYYQQLIELFLEKNVVKLALSPDIICETEKRKIKGLITDKQVNDSLLIDTLHFFMKYQVKDNDKVHLITYDNGFFEKDQLSKKYRRDDLEILVLYGIEQFEEKINMKHIHLSSKTEQGIGAEEFDINTDYESEEYLEKMKQDENDYIGEMVEDFESKALKQPDYIQIIRKGLIENIKKKLEKCRELDSWDNRSELKLYQWLENRNENELPLSSISELIVISKNVDRYFDIHLNNHDSPV